jgi:hypothetical protein
VVVNRLLIFSGILALTLEAFSAAALANDKSNSNTYLLPYSSDAANHIARKNGQPVLQLLALEGSKNRSALVKDDTISDQFPGQQPILLAAAIGSDFMESDKKKSAATLANLSDDDNSLRLLEPSIGKYRLEELVATYQYEDMIFVPLGYFSELIDLAVSINPDTGIAEGFIFDQNKTFYLDANRGEVTIEGKLSQFNKQRIAIRELDDIYVDSNLFREWFPLKVDIDLFASRLKIVSDQPLPFEQRKQREEQAKRARSPLPTKRGYDKQSFPYKNWTHPMINQTARVGVTRGEDGDYTDHFAYTTFLTADLFRMESSWYLSGTDNEPFDKFRATFARRDPDGNLLGRMRAKEYAFGNINEPRVEHVTRPLEPQVGAVVSNYPLARQLQYDSHNFRGDLPPGWQVELYRNNVLLGFRPFSEDGQYRFDDVPLLYGNNYFRLVFYGPQGQQREENYTFNLDRSLTEPGQHYYRALISEDDDSGARALLQYDYGISQKASIATSFTSVPLDSEILLADEEENHNYLTAGIRGFYRSMFYNADFIKDFQSGQAFDWKIQARINGAILNIGEAYFQDGFVSEEYPQTFNTIERRSDISIDTAIPSSYFPRIPITFDYEREAYENNIVLNRFSNRISTNKYGLAISNTINLTGQTGLDSSVLNTFQISRRAFGYNFRGAFSYRFAPESGSDSATLTVDGFKLWNYFISTGFTRIVTSDNDQVFFNINKSHGAYSLGLNTRYSTGGVLSVDLNFTIGLGHEPRTNTWKPEYRPVASQGAMSTLAFLDKNSNGIKDGDEEGLAGIKIRVNGGDVPTPADDNGVVYVTGIEPYRNFDLDIALETLEDPLWQPSIKGTRINLRPGHVAEIDFPIIVTGEVDGTVVVQLGDQKREVSGVIVELLDMEGKLVEKTKSTYDGFYLMSKIPVGKYQLLISREQTDSLGLMPVKPTIITVEPENPIVYGMDFVLQKKFTTE